VTNARPANATLQNVMYLDLVNSGGGSLLAKRYVRDAK
jgi:hypothetical protein